MPLVSGIVVYFLIWWVVIFAMLPIGIKPAEDSLRGGMPGAPADPQLKRKAVWTTIVSAVIWVLIDLVIKYDLISFREMAAGM